MEGKVEIPEIIIEIEFYDVVVALRIPLTEDLSKTSSSPCLR